MPRPFFTEEDHQRVEEPFLDPEHSSERKPVSPYSMVNKAVIILFCVGLAAVVALSVRGYMGENQANLRAHTEALRSNGTHAFRKTVILISFDGFRADYLDRGITPHLHALRDEANAFQAEYMNPSFPSITFPNHYTIATGLYPETHGIVANEFYDPVLNQTFYYKNDLITRDAQWWGGEPIWVTAERQGHLAGIDMWPGSTAPIGGVLPTYLIAFSDPVAPRTKVDQLMTWLDLPLDRRPTFLASYVPEVDHAGHAYSPDSRQVNDSLVLADDAVGYLRASLAARNLTDVVDVVYLSDHGMASVPDNQIIYLEDLVDPDLLELVSGYPLAGLWPKHASDTARIYEALRIQSAGQRWAVYLREDIPARFHYAHNDRIPPIVCIPEVGWTFYTRHQYDHSHLYSGKVSKTIGVHGYDNLDPTMRAIFLAHGPSFHAGKLVGQAADGQPQDSAGALHPPIGPAPRDVETATIQPPFDNVEVYNLLCHLLGLTPSANNGTLAWASRVE
ncbi:hypothetical protein IWQ60_010558 [Tieghemiomyces parasiticus]|uniref:Phosphodiest-domain-containing protein n=1 Tax=Tieghemiomyces parasiticus TaxID=78921 RepID=A0A9W7ZQI0_9FUNG|nr:hypothetical protein IWQ60_010558 [Tieghemiomyces parasiticus]